MVGAGGAINLNPSHPISRRANPDIQIKKYLVIASLREAISCKIGHITSWKGIASLLAMTDVGSL
jgi:hypothetical protein